MKFLKKQTAEVKDTSAMVAEIHDAFYGEIDRLKSKAERELSKLPMVDPDKSDRLKALGFSSTKTVKDQKKLEERRSDHENFIEAVQYFSQKYPHLKLITVGSVKKLCKKYGLIYGSVSNYLGDVPEKNLIEIENAKIDESDLHVASTNWVTHNNWRDTWEQMRQITHSDLIGMLNEKSEIEHIYAGLEIAAPPSDFNLKGKEVVDHQIQEIPDPIVMQPVRYKHQKYYLIITAWGPEASDPSVVNERNN